MPRGRHRHSPPLHRLLPPSAIAGVSLVCALTPWVVTDATVLRTLAAIAAATAVTGAVVMRRWDLQAGRQVADLTRARASDEWRFEERIAELEMELEEARELRGRLEQKLRSRRAELTGLRNEHAALLRRYATAETERASALEGRRLLEIEAAPEVPALPAAQAAGPKDERGTGDFALFSPEGAELFLRARAALARLGSTGDAKDTEDAADTGAPEAAEAEATVHEAAPETAGGVAQGPAGEGGPEGRPGTAGTHAPLPAATAGETPAAPAADPARPARSVPQRPPGHFTVPTAAAVVPPAPARRPAVEGGFDFFGTKSSRKGRKGTPSAGLDAVRNEDPADPAGQESLTLHKAEAESQYKPAMSRVVDLTAHDETESIEMPGLRTAAS
ncbi:hypothetical protein [Streptomyces sp. F-3]|uniref:hypothetical protein n=1 Tax=Streptomyces sp. F-3 TaxID=1840095 RepID=UPI0008348608